MRVDIYSVISANSIHIGCRLSPFMRKFAEFCQKICCAYIFIATNSLDLEGLYFRAAGQMPHFSSLYILGNFSDTLWPK